MLLTVAGMEYNLFVAADTWENSYVGNITAFSDDVIIEKEYGDAFTHHYAYCRMEGNELKSFESFDSYDGDSEAWEMEYVHVDEYGNESNITEEEFYSGDGLYGVHDVEGEWYEINENNIQKYLLMGD